MSYQNGKIYKIVNDVNDIIYIGSTKNKLCKRIVDHRSKAKTKTTPFYKAMREIGIHNFKIILIKPFPCNSSEELTAEEYRVMREMKEQGEQLYNFMMGTTETQPRFSYGNICKRKIKNKYYWVFRWRKDGNHKSKSFSISKYGEWAKLLCEDFRKSIYPESVDESQYVEIVFVD